MNSLIKYRLFARIIFVVIFISTIKLQAQSNYVYKEVGKTTLNLKVLKVKDVSQKESLPAIVFFYGGGWKSGHISQLRPQAKHFAKKGIVTFLVEYRIENKNGTTPFASLMDAKPAVRYIRKNAGNFGIDPNKIVACGASAGGHLAASAALIENYNESTDDLEVSCIPNALILLNPVIDNSPSGYGYDRIGQNYRFFSPLHNIKKGVPPTIILQGTKDPLIPVETVEYFKKAVQRVGSRCDLILYEGETHGFFNYKYRENYDKTLKDIEMFLQSLGYLN